MYDRRVKIFIAVALSFLLIGLMRLSQMQLLASSQIQDEIAALKLRRNRTRQFETVRGNILDRDGRILATDTPEFQLVISYDLTSYGDPRVVQAAEKIARSKSTDPSLYDFINEVNARRAELDRIIRDCVKFGISRRDAADRIRNINNDVWNQRAFFAWVRNGPDPNFVARYEGGINSVRRSAGLREFERQVPDPNERNRKIYDVQDIPEVAKSYPLIDLKTDDDIFAAQVEFMDINGVDIVPSGYRDYPYGSAAAHTIGWVGPARSDADKALFEQDPLGRYLPGDVCGKRPGAEYVCEAILRGRRGEQSVDIDGNLVYNTDPQYGRDVQLTLDIELQQQIEEYLADPEFNAYASSPMAAVVLDIRSGDILALVSLPTYDLNRVRDDYGRLMADEENTPLRNRAIYGQYPPGSSVKPIILVAGMEAGAITADESISCPAHAAPSGWPNCWIWKDNGSGHDLRWVNNARNAIKGSCNIYFSHLADRLDVPVLQGWLFRFGFGHRLPLEDSLAWPDPSEARRFLQGQGILSSSIPRVSIETVDDLPPLAKFQKKYFGMGQGNLRATPLQVANAIATLARGGQYIPPRLFLAPKATGNRLQEPVDLGISPDTLRVVYDGMSAVVNESGGTAYNPAYISMLSARGVKAYGKTGSTEDPETAWFAGFAEDSGGAKLAIAIVVEGGLHGSSDAAPLGLDIIQLCAFKGYVGTPPPELDLP